MVTNFKWKRKKKTSTTIEDSKCIFEQNESLTLVSLFQAIERAGKTVAYSKDDQVNLGPTSVIGED